MTNKIKTVADLEAEDPVYLVCASAETAKDYFPDNLDANCNECEEAIVYRPNTPKNAVKICMRCAEIMRRGATNKGISSEARLTQETIDEVNQYLAQYGQRLDFDKRK